MFLYTIWQLRFVSGRVEFMRGDPLLFPDIPGNEPKVWRRSLVDDFDEDCVYEEDDTFESTFYKRVLPTWFRYRDFPTLPAERIWSYVRKYDESESLMEDRRFHFPRQVREMEIAIKEGHERILIRERSVALYAMWLQRIGDYFGSNAKFFGTIGFWTAVCFPTKWQIYSFCSFYAIIHAYCYTHFWRTDRLSRYKMFELPLEDMDEIEEYLYLQEEFWVLELIPKSKLTTMYLKHQLYACASCILTFLRMMQVEDIIVGPPNRDIFSVHGLLTNTPYYLPLTPELHHSLLEGYIPTDTWKIQIVPGYGICIDTILLVGVAVFFAWEEWHALKREFYKFYIPYKEAVDNGRIPHEIKDWIF